MPHVGATKKRGRTQEGGIAAALLPPRRPHRRQTAPGLLTQCLHRPYSNHAPVGASGTGGSLATFSPESLVALRGPPRRKAWILEQLENLVCKLLLHWGKRQLLGLRLQAGTYVSPDPRTWIRSRRADGGTCERGRASCRMKLRRSPSIVSLPGVFLATMRQASARRGPPAGSASRVVGSRVTAIQDGERLRGEQFSSPARPGDHLRRLWERSRRWRRESGPREPLPRDWVMKMLRPSNVSWDGRGAGFALDARDSMA